MSRTIRISMDGDEGTALPVPDDVTASDEDLIAAVKGKKDVPGFDMTASILREKFELRRYDEGETEDDEGTWTVVGNRLDEATVVVENTGVRPDWMGETITVQFEVTLNKGADPATVAEELFDYFARAGDEDVPGVSSVDGYEVVNGG